jgi:hypothetical protein
MLEWNFNVRIGELKRILSLITYTRICIQFVCLKIAFALEPNDTTNIFFRKMLLCRGSNVLSCYVNWVLIRCVYVLQFWDTRQATPIMNIALPERCYCADVVRKHLILQTCLSDIKVILSVLVGIVLLFLCLFSLFKYRFLFVVLLSQKWLKKFPLKKRKKYVLYCNNRLEEF